MKFLILTGAILLVVGFFLIAEQFEVFATEGIHVEQNLIKIHLKDGITAEENLQTLKSIIIE